MRALVEQASGYEVVLVAANKPDAGGIEWARSRGLATWAQDSKGLSKAEFEDQLGAALDQHGVGTIALAGFMRILSAAFVEQWSGRIVNIHPSLLPKYRGLDTHRRALDAGDVMGGCSVHVVTEDLDAGEVLGLSEVLIEPGDTAASLEQRVLAAEHALYPRILSEFVKR